MLYDPKWGKQVETKADPLTLEALVAWMETQSPDKTYRWSCSKGGCLLGLYGHATGCKWRSFHTDLSNRGQLSIAADFPHTFGAALERARAALSSTK